MTTANPSIALLGNDASADPADHRAVLHGRAWSGDHQHDHRIRWACGALGEEAAYRTVIGVLLKPTSEAEAEIEGVPA